MSGDVQPRKRKDKRKKKGSLEARRSEEYSEESAFFRRQSSAASDDDEVLQHHSSIGGSDEVIHVHKESNLGGNICSKIVFFGLLGALGVMVGLIIIEYHGISDVDTQSAVDSPWSVMLEGWVDNNVAGHDDHEPAEHSSHEEEEHDEHNEHVVEPEYSEGEHEDEEAEEDIDEVSFVKQTYEDLKAAYNHVTPEDSEAEPTEETSLKSNEEDITESEPEASETEETEEEEEEEVKGDDPLGQWKSDSGPELLAKEVENVQTDSEIEEESEDDDVSTGGPKSTEINEELSSPGIIIKEDILEPKTNSKESEEKTESYENSDITNEADWEIREELDEADRDLEDGDYPA